jgi:hypothetical protein
MDSGPDGRRNPGIDILDYILESAALLTYFWYQRRLRQS